MQTTSPTPKIHLLLWRALITASAAGLSSYLFDPNGAQLSFFTCFAMHTLAWATVIVAWVRYSRENGESFIAYLVPCVALVLTVSAVRSAFFPCPLRPELRQYMALTAAVENNDLNGVQTLLARDEKPDYTPPLPPMCNSDMACWYDRKTPLYIAVKNDNVAIAAALLKRGASASALQGGSESILVAAAEKGDANMIRLLLHHGAHTDDGDCNGPALSNAVAVEYWETAELLRSRANPQSLRAQAREPDSHLHP